MSERTIYSYATATDLKEGWLKVGDTERDTETRVGEQVTASNREPLEVQKTWSIPSKFRDYDIHKILEKMGKKRYYKTASIIFKSKEIPKGPKQATEFFQCSVDDVDCAINQLLHGINKRDSWLMRQEQTDFVLKAYDSFKSGNKEFLGNCKCRFGKTFSAYNLMKKLGCKTVLVLTYKPAVGGEWETNLINHILFNGWGFYHALNYDKNNPIKFSHAKRVLFASFQDILGKDLNGNIKNKWTYIQSYLNKIGIDLLIIDEAHFGADKKKARDFIESLNYQYRLDLSGTPLALLMSGDYTDANTYTWSYVDEQKKKALDVKEHGRESVYYWLPELSLFRYELGKEVIKDSDAYTPEEGLKLNKFYSSDDGETFKNASAVEKWLDILSRKDEQLGASPFNNNELVNKLDHTFWILPDVNSVRAMKRLMEKHHFFKQYRTIMASDDNDGEGRNTVDLVKGSIRDHEKTITLSCGKLNTGITIKEWTGVFYLTDTEQPETYWQTVFRCQSACEEMKKKECFVFDYNPNRTLKMIYEYCEKLVKKSQTTPGAIREFLDVVKVFSYEDNQLVKMSNDDLEKIIESVIDIATATGRFGSPKMFSVGKLNGEIMEVLARIIPGKGDKSNVDISTSDLKKGKTFKGIQKGKKGGKKGDPMKMWVERAITVVKSIPMFLFVSEANEESVKDIITTKETDLFKEITTITVDEFKSMLDSGFLIEERVDRSIQALYLAEKAN